MAFSPCNRRDKFDWMGRVGYLEVGWASRPCNRMDKFDMYGRWNM